MPQAFEKLDFQLQVMRRHFLDDPDALNTWDEYENDVRYAYRHNLLQTLSSPLSIPVSIPHTLYLFMFNSRAGDGSP
jgi:hypothetical protein